jgi:hypothetical protein
VQCLGRRDTVRTTGLMQRLRLALAQVHDPTGIELTLPFLVCLARWRSRPDAMELVITQGDLVLVLLTPSLCAADP